MGLRWRVSGTLAERLAAKSRRDESTGCLVWVGSLKPNGYAKLVYEGANLYAHRAAYELVHGPIPDGLTIDHLCKNRACIEVGHMEVVTRGENTKRGATKTHCKRGHDLNDESNLWRWERGGYSLRSCKECQRINARERYRASHPDAVPRV